MVNSYAIEHEHIKIHGRTSSERNPLTLFWTGSGIELNATGSELLLEVESDYEQYEQWISIWINGAEVSRLMLEKGRRWITLFRGMNAGKVKHVRVMKEVQAMSGDERSLLQLHALQGDGKLLPVPSKRYRLEFIGDSITSGEGAIGAREEEDWLPMFFSASHNYTKLTADLVDADYRVLSQSGWGVLTSWDNNPNHALPLYYEQVCGLLSGARNEALGANQPNDFASWQPDAVIINLGTNDNSAFYQPPWRDEHTGVQYKQRLLDNSSYHPEDIAAFEAAAVAFLHKLRACNKHAQLLWAYGMLGIPMLPAIHRAVEAYKAESGDEKVSVFQLPIMTEATVGARSHPGQLAHVKAAEELAGYLATLLLDR